MALMYAPIYFLLDLSSTCFLRLVSTLSVDVARTCVYFPDNLIQVETEASEAFTRIGAKGASCVLHISPWGLTLALPVRSVVHHFFIVGDFFLQVFFFFSSQVISVKYLTF